MGGKKQTRDIDANGHRLYTVADAYSEADLVTYPSEYEGFANAFLEAIYFKRPVVCNRYAIYRLLNHQRRGITPNTQ
jgi:glycosyltransferase involved in cell wall biosynthesis